MTAVLTDHDAAEIADLLGLLEDWLMHADEGVLEPLARFAFEGAWVPQQHLGWLIDRLGEHSVRLHQQLQASGQQEGQGDE